MNATGGKNSKLILAAMIFAVSMTFIDQTIVAIAIPTIQQDVDLSATGVQWIINGYLLSLSALFAFGGRLADIAGHRKMVVLGVIVFATASALCGATPTGRAAEAWLIVFRIIQGAGAAIMFPAALAIVLESFPVSERGRAMAIFFGIAGGLTSIGPIAGGYLTEWTWRSIFWINVPVAIIALFLTWKAKPADERHPGKIDYKGTVLTRDGAHNGGGIMNYGPIDSSKASVVAWGIRDSDGTRFPWAVRSGTLTYIGENPFTWMGTDTDRVIAFALTDGSVMNEEIVACERPSLHQYRWLDRPAFPFSLLVRGAEATWNTGTMATGGGGFTRSGGGGGGALGGSFLVSTVALISCSCFIKAP